MTAALQLVPYALIATLSPLGVAATLTVMRTGRLQALGFGLGVVAGQLLACTTLVLLGSVTIPHRSTRPSRERSPSGSGLRFWYSRSSFGGGPSP